MADTPASPRKCGALDTQQCKSADVATRGGCVIETADGIAHVEGLPGTMASELLRFEDGPALELKP